MSKRKSGKAKSPRVEFSLKSLIANAQSTWSIRWRTLEREGEPPILVYAAFVPDIGYSGFTKELLKEAPCSHCGQTGTAHLPHLCTGLYSHGGPCAFDGERLSDGRHACHGRPSRSWHGTLSWKTVDGWKEV